MGHLILLVLHVVALFTGGAALFVTVPLHVIYALMASRRNHTLEAPTPETHVKCPDCAELVRREARVCKHCGCRLIPQVDVGGEQA